jgi:membrane carboxypeptidase/penicillin-binding protein PbpC
MKTRVIPNEMRDLSKARGLCCVLGVIRARSVRSLAVLGMTAWFAWLLLPKTPLLDGISFSQSVRDRNGKLLRVTLSADQKFRIWTPLEEISPDLINATLRYEDKYYARHPGVNPIALARGATELLRFHRATTGGSTITMQLARLRFRLHTRTLSGKLEQIMRALELERHYSKNQILEAYLNLAPYGRNIEGVGAASEIYFDKSTSKLSRLEAIALSVIPQSPSRRALHTDRDNHSVNLAHACKRGANFSPRILFRRCLRPRMAAIKSPPRSIWKSSGRLSEG